MNKNDILKYALIAGGAYLAYWYVTSYGPHGAVKNTAGQPVNPSWWDSWFGGSPAPPVQNAPSQAQLPPGTPSVYRPNTTNESFVPATSPSQPVQPTQPVVTQPSSQPPSSNSGAASVANALLNLAGGVTMLNADQWNYYYTQMSGVQQTADLFTPGNRGELITVDTYLARRAMAGLSGIGDIVRTPSIPGLPSMSFGGSLKRPGAMGTLAGIRKHTFGNTVH